VHVEDYNHLDYMWADDANNFVNQLIFTFIDALPQKSSQGKQFIANILSR